MNVETLKHSIKVCMFDQYGTVVDMQGGLREAAAGFLEDKRWKGSANDFVTWWRRTHFENSMVDALYVLMKLFDREEDGHGHDDEQWGQPATDR